MMFNLILIYTKLKIYFYLNTYFTYNYLPTSVDEAFNIPKFV